MASIELELHMIADYIERHWMEEVVGKLDKYSRDNEVLMDAIEAIAAGASDPKAIAQTVLDQIDEWDSSPSSTG